MKRPLGVILLASYFILVALNLLNSSHELWGVHYVEPYATATRVMIVLMTLLAVVYIGAGVSLFMMRRFAWKLFAAALLLNIANIIWVYHRWGSGFDRFSHAQGMIITWVVLISASFYAKKLADKGILV